jgi:hypothetical protein
VERKEHEAEKPFERLKDLTRRIVRVPKAEVDKRLRQEQRRKKKR